MQNKEFNPKQVQNKLLNKPIILQMILTWIARVSDEALW